MARRVHGPIRSLTLRSSIRHGRYSLPLRSREELRRTGGSVQFRHRMLADRLAAEAPTPGLMEQRRRFGSDQISRLERPRLRVTTAAIAALNANLGSEWWCF